MRLIDADALIDDIKNHLWDWENVNGITAQTVLKQTITDVENQPTASPWHRVEEEPRDGQECVIAYLGPTDWIYEHATYHSDLNKALEDDIFIEGMDGFIVDSDVGYARHGLFKYWMPIEPPKEDTDGDK